MQTPVQTHNERPAAVWSSGGRAYERISRGIADALEHCMLRLDPQPGERLLDLATGTGWSSRLAAARGARVIGVDIAAALLAAARQRAEEEDLDIDYQLGDAESLPFEHDTFDAVVSTFGIMFASRPETAASELARVTRPGGRIGLTVWQSDSNLFRMFQVMRPYMPPPASPAPASPFAWGNQERLRELLGASFALRFEKGTSYYREPGAEAAWDTFSTGYGPTKMLATTLPADRLADLRRDFIAFHQEFATELGICVPRDYWVVIGVRR